MARRCRRTAARTRRAVLRDRARTTRATASIRRRGTASLTTHAIAAGLGIRDARTIANSLRRNAAKQNITGTTGRCHAGRRMRDVQRFTPDQVAQAAATYRPRKVEFVAVAAQLRQAALAVAA
ncbi:hypothetical protein [Streptomyces sp. NPDC058045]|uniref:hypothetical protein n=1 Tax=Streptomyces sp. NPDC058045 TaxID=3346311 RepID=UPI0036EA0327